MRPKSCHAGENLCIKWWTGLTSRPSVVNFCGSSGHAVTRLKSYRRLWKMTPWLTYILPLTVLDVPFIAIMHVRQLLAELFIKGEQGNLSPLEFLPRPLRAPSGAAQWIHGPS